MFKESNLFFKYCLKKLCSNWCVILVELFNVVKLIIIVYNPKKIIIVQNKYFQMNISDTI
jgi:hypothetical protein